MVVSWRGGMVVGAVALGAGGSAHVCTCGCVSWSGGLEAKKVRES